jgi:hypothetical protein
MLLPKELREISGFPGYFVSSGGRVFSTFYNRGTDFRELKLKRGWHGYMEVTLYSSGDSPKTMLVHRIVALAWLPAPENSSFIQVRHLDDDPTNNEVSNLAWGTAATNNRERSTTLLTEQKVREIKELLKIHRRSRGETGHADGKLTYAEIGKMYGVSKLTISSIANGKSWRDVD